MIKLLKKLWSRLRRRKYKDVAIVNAGSEYRRLVTEVVVNQIDIELGHFARAYDIPLAELSEYKRASRKDRMVRAKAIAFALSNDCEVHFEVPNV